MSHKKTLTSNNNYLNKKFLNCTIKTSQTKKMTRNFIHYLIFLVKNRVSLTISYFK